jgi:hypothetical protein
MIEDLARRTGVAVEEADADCLRELAGAPLAQKRTSSNKAFVYVTGAAIVKGPYLPQALKLVNNLRYPHLIECLEEAVRLPNGRRGVFRWSKLLVREVGGGRTYYLSGENVGWPERARDQRASTRVDADFRVVQRGTSVQRVSELEKVKRADRFERHPDFAEEIAVASLQHLYFRHLLDIGDSGTHNILVRADREQSGRPVAGIDFDEQRRSHQRRTGFGYLFKQGHRYHEEVYGPYLGQVVQLGEVAALLARALDEMNDLCRRWAGTLPQRRQPQAVGDIRAEDVLVRREQIRPLLMRGG